MSNLSAFLGIILSLLSIAGIALAIYEYLRKTHTIREHVIRISIIGAVLVPIVILGGFISTSTNIMVHPPSIPFVGSTSVAETPTATPSPTPTPPPQVVKTNQTMTCTNCTSGGYNFSLIVKEARIDPVKNQVTLLVAVQNNTSDSFSPYINYLRLQDMQTADTYDGTGDAFSNFPISAYQTILFRITYQFLPVAGHTYSLSCNLSHEFDLSTITIKFY